MLAQMLPLQDKVEKLSSLTVLENKEADIVPFPDFVQLDNVGMVEDFEDVDLVDEGRVVFDFLLLNCLNRKLLVTLPMLRQVNDAETAVCKLRLERVNLFDVALSRVDKVLWLVL